MAWALLTIGVLATAMVVTINDDYERTWEDMRVYSLNPEGHLSVTTFHAILTDAKVMSTTTRIYEKLLSRFAYA